MSVPPSPDFDRKPESTESRTEQSSSGYPQVSQSNAKKKADNPFACTGCLLVVGAIGWGVYSLLGAFGRSVNQAVAKQDAANAAAHAQIARREAVYSAAYAQWIGYIQKTEPAIYSVDPFDPKFPNHLTLTVLDGDESAYDARMQAQQWYDAFRLWRIGHAEASTEADEHHDPTNCIVTIQDQTGHELAWADQLGAKN